MNAKKLFKDLMGAVDEIQRTDAPGDPNADFPAYITCHMAAVMLERRQGLMPPMSRSQMFDFLCGSFGFILERFTQDELPEDQILLVRDAMVTLDALSPSRAVAKKAALQAA